MLYNVVSEEVVVLESSSSDRKKENSIIQFSKPSMITVGSRLADTRGICPY